VTKHGDERQWSIPGSGGEPILGVSHAPAAGQAADTAAAADAPLATVLIAHGFKGYMDYGMFPRIARELAAAGCRVHRFNFSHSGMTRDTATFARPDLFARDTWNRQVDDLAAVADAVRAGTLAGGGVPLVLFGHSRGGVTVLLAAGRGDVADPAGVITAAAPADAVRLSPADRQRLLDEGFLPSPSSRTGQELRVGRDWLAEIEADPAGHDPCVQAGRIDCPVLVLHGGDDATVPAGDAERLGLAARRPARVVVIPGANHVFDTPNPMPDDAAPSPALQTLLDETGRFVRELAGAGD
jgi:alpha-beta hydrolase superfamily lysophospholipase